MNPWRVDPEMPKVGGPTWPGQYFTIQPPDSSGFPDGATGYAVYIDAYKPHGPLVGAHWIREDDGTWSFYPHHKYQKGLKRIGTYNLDGTPKNKNGS